MTDDDRAAIELFQEIRELNLDMDGAWSDLYESQRDALRRIAASRHPAPAVDEDALAAALIESLADVETGPLSDAGFNYAEQEPDGMLSCYVDENAGGFPDASIDVPQIANVVVAHLVERGKAHTLPDRDALARVIDSAIYPHVNRLTGDGWQASMNAADAVLAALREGTK